MTIQKFVNVISASLLLLAAFALSGAPVSASAPFSVQFEHTACPALELSNLGTLKSAQNAAELSTADCSALSEQQAMRQLNLARAQVTTNDRLAFTAGRNNGSPALIPVTGGESFFSRFNDTGVYTNYLMGKVQYRNGGPFPR